MGKIVALVGGFGALLALLGSIMAIFTGGVGVAAGAGEAGSHVGRGFGAAMMALVGLAGAVAANERLRIGAVLLIASAAISLALAFWFYAAGAVLMVAAAMMAIRTRPDLKGTDR